MKIKKKLITMMAAVAVMSTVSMNVAADMKYVGGKTVYYNTNKSGNTATADTTIMYGKGELRIITTAYYFIGGKQYSAEGDSGSIISNYLLNDSKAAATVTSASSTHQVTVGGSYATLYSYKK